MKSFRMIAFSGLCLLLSGLSSLGEEGDKPTAAQRVSAFESILQQHSFRIDEVRGVQQPKAQRKAVRAFYANLDTVEMKLEALDMMSDRFVCMIPEDMTESLVAPLLVDPKEVVQVRALMAYKLNRLSGKTELSARILEMASSDSVKIRVAAVRAMARTGLPVFATAVVEAMDDSDAKVRKAALFEWNRWLESNFRDFVLPMTVDADVEVAAEAIRGIYADKFGKRQEGIEAIASYYFKLDAQAKKRFRQGMDRGVEEGDFDAGLRKQVYQLADE